MSSRLAFSSQLNAQAVISVCQLRKQIHQILSMRSLNVVWSFNVLRRKSSAHPRVYTFSDMTLFVPKIRKSKDGNMDFLRIYNQADLTSLPSGIWGIREPDDEWEGHARMNAG